MQKIIVTCTTLVSLILTSHPVLAEQLRVDEFTTKEAGCGTYLSKPRSKKSVLWHFWGQPMEMRINGKKVLFNALKNGSNKKAIFLSQDQKIEVQLDVTKFGKFLYGEYQEIDRAILTVKKGKSKVKLNVTGGSGC